MFDPNFTYLKQSTAAFFIFAQNLYLHSWVMTNSFIHWGGGDWFIIAGIASVKSDKMKNWDDWEWEKEVVNNVRLSDLVFKRENVDVVGVIVHRIPSCTRKDEMIRKLFSELNIPYVGAMPEDSVLQSVQVGCF